MHFSDDVTQWGITHFSDALVSDVRRSRRLVKLAIAWASQPGKSIPQLFDRPYDIQAAYDFLNHPEALPDNLQAAHRQNVLEQLSRPGRYLLLEDSSDLSWSGKEPIAGLGPIGEGRKKQQGFSLHSVLAVRWPAQEAALSSEKRPPVTILGLLDQQFCVRSSQKTSKKGDRAETTDKLESHVWEDATSRLGSAPDDEPIQWVRVCDCAADIFEFLSGCQKLGHSFIVRAAKDRVLDGAQGKEGEHLFEHIVAQPPAGGFELALRARPGQEARVARLSVSFSKVSLRSPKRPGHRAGAFPAVQCMVVRVWEADAPDGVEGLEWLLLTDQRVETYFDAREVALQYAARWIIEEFHKGLKTGLGAERLQFESAHALFAAISIMSISALRLLDLRERVRLTPEAPAEQSGLQPLELKLLATRLERDLKTVKDVALAIGRLGGHMNRKADGMPGWITLWRGWNELQAMVTGASLYLTMQRFD